MSNESEEKERDAEFERLLACHLDGDSGAEGGGRLAELLAGRPDRALRFARSAMLHHQLHRVLKHQDFDSTEGSAPALISARLASFVRERQWLLAAAMLLVAVAAYHRSTSAHVNSAVVATEPFVAQLTVGADLAVPSPAGGFVRSGASLQIGEEVLEIQFLNGAKAVLQGPALIVFDDVHRCTLAYGNLSATIPEQFCDFVVATPDVLLRGQSASFGLDVRYDGRTEMHVAGGWVRVNRTDDWGKGLIVESQQAIVVDRDSKLSDIPFDLSKFALSIEGQDHQPGVRANFDDDDRVGGADALRKSVAGLGWETSWESFKWQDTRLEQTHPFGSNGGPRLLIDLQGKSGDRNPHNHIRVNRRYGAYGAVDPMKSHVIRWKWRFEGNVEDLDNFYTQIQFFADSEPRKMTGPTNGWLIGFVPADMVQDDPRRIPGAGGDVYKGRWYFFNGVEGSDFSRDNMFDTEMPLRGGVVYQFMVIVDPRHGVYEAQIYDGDRVVSHGGLRFRNRGRGPQPVLHFGGMCTDGDLTSSVDAIEVLPYDEVERAEQDPLEQQVWNREEWSRNQEANRRAASGAAKLLARPTAATRPISLQR